MEQNVYNYRDLPPLFSGLSVAHAFHLGMRKLYRVLNFWVAAGLAVRLRNGMYARGDANQFRIAAELYDGYVGFSSALYLHGLKTEIESIVRVCVSKREKPCYFKNVKLSPIFISGQPYGTELLDGVLVSTYPKTIFDMLQRPGYADFFDLYRALNTREFSKSEWEELLYYAGNADLSTVRRLGLVLEGRAPRWFVDALMALNKPIGRSFFRTKSTNNFNAMWRIYDDINVKRWEDAV